MAKKNKLPPLVTLARNGQEQPKLSSLVTLAKKAQKPNLSPLITLAKITKKIQTYTIGNLRQKGREKMSDIHKEASWHLTVSKLFCRHLTILLGQVYQR